MRAYLRDCSASSTLPIWNSSVPECTRHSHSVLLSTTLQSKVPWQLFVLHIQQICLPSPAINSSFWCLTACLHMKQSLWTAISYFELLMPPAQSHYLLDSLHGMISTSNGIPFKVNTQLLKQQRVLVGFDLQVHDKRSDKASCRNACMHA